MFLDKLPLTTFPINEYESIFVRDIIRAVRVDPKLKTDPFMFTVYDAVDNETPEVISHMFYGTPQYHWVVMLMNDKFDPYNDFPKSDSVVRQQTIYQFGDLNGLHHYENTTGEWVDEFTIEAERVPITNYEHMTRLNDQKRTIKVLRKELLPEFVQMYQGMIYNG